MHLYNELNFKRKKTRSMEIILHSEWCTFVIALDGTFEF